MPQNRRRKRPYCQASAFQQLPAQRQMTGTGGCAAPAIHAPRPGSKLDQVLLLLSAPSGATAAELGSATGWLDHSMRAALTGLRRRGYQVSLTRGERDGA